MKPKLLLRIAAALMLLHAIGHSFGALGWKKAPNAAVGQVISGMLNNHFKFMGRQVSIGSFYEGYGIIMILVLLLITLILWLLSYNMQYPLAAAIAIFLLLLGVCEYIYFFPFAAAFSFMAGFCTGLALLRNSGIQTAR